MTTRQVDIIYSPTKTKGHGGVKGAPCGHQKPRDIHNGLYFLHGTGCSKWDDCLSCPFEKCVPKSRTIKLAIKEEENKTTISTTKTEARPTWKLRACPRCGGDMHLSIDIYTDETDEAYVCLQCGYRDLLCEPLVFTRAKWIGKPEEVTQEEEEAKQRYGENI